MDTLLSRFAFIFLIYAVITSGYINEILSCQMQKFLHESKYFRHLLGVLLVFVFIMMEGGWSWKKDVDDMADNDWSRGNVMDTLTIAVVIYLIFLISSKSKLVPNLIFFGLVFTVYLINTQRNYYKDRNMITEEQNKQWLQVTQVLFIMSLIVLAFGFIDYIGYQQRNYGKAFTWKIFMLGVPVCKRLM